MKKIFISIFLGLAWLQLTTVVVASSSFTVTPAIIERAFSPGESAEIEVSIKNTAPSPLPVTLYAEAPAPFAEFDQKTRSRYDASQWIRFSEEVVVFSAGETKVVPVRVDVPETAAPGGHYARIGVRALPLEPTVIGAEQTVLPEISISVLFTVRGEIQESLQLVTKNVIPWYSTVNTQTPLTINVRNSGNVHTLASPIVVLQKDGVVVQRVTASPQLLLPGFERDFSVSLPEQNVAGRYSVVVYLTPADEQKEQSAARESLVIGPPPLQIAAVAATVWVGATGYRRRKNVKKAYHILVGRY